MKRKVVTVTEYYGGLAGPRSVLQRLVDVFSPPRHDFYPPEQKRHFYPDGVTLKSIAFADGTLYGGCCALGCPRRCVALSEFEPDSGLDFRFALQAHSSALSAKDLDVATEQRGVLDEQRDPRCRPCRAAHALPAPVPAELHAESPEAGAEPSLGNGPDSTKIETNVA